MTFIIKATKVGDYTIEIGQQKFESTYYVGAYSGYREETKLWYPTREKAEKRFGYLKRKYKEAVIC